MNLDAVEQIASLGGFLRRGDGPLDVIDHWQQVAQERQVGVASFVFQLVPSRARAFRDAASDTRYLVRVQLDATF